MVDRRKKEDIFENSLDLSGAIINQINIIRKSMSEAGPDDHEFIKQAQDTLEYLMYGLGDLNEDVIQDREKAIIKLKKQFKLDKHGAIINEGTEYIKALNYLNYAFLIRFALDFGIIARKEMVPKPSPASNLPTLG